MRGGRSVALNRWRPSLAEADDQVAAAWEIAAARSADAIINSGWLSGAIEQAAANTVGVGMRLKAIPENSLFGMSDRDAQEWGTMVERHFGIWASNPAAFDIEGRRSFGQMQDAVFRSSLATGEMLSEAAWRVRPGIKERTKIRALPPMRLKRDSDPMRGLNTGIFQDVDGLPIGYLTYRRDRMGVQHDHTVAARDPLGRRLVGHFFDGPLGAVRGIGPLVPVLQVLWQFDQLSDATLAGQIVKTLWAATIESEMPTMDVLQGLVTPEEQSQAVRRGEAPPSGLEYLLDMSAGYYEGAKLDLNLNGRIGHLMPGDKLNLAGVQSPGSDYEAYAADLKREIARALGVAYESLTGDYKGATYYSLGYGSAEIYNITKRRRANMLSPWCAWVYELWLEEAIWSEIVPFPGGHDGFVANRAAAARSVWIGDPKPLADILKSAKAFEVLDKLGVVPAAHISEAFGYDIEDVYSARQQEQDLRKQYSLPEPVHGNAGGQPAPGEAEETDDEGRDDND